MRLNLATSSMVVLAAFVLLSIAPLPAAYEEREPVLAPPSGADRPVAEICLPDAASDACAALFLDEDGYELCLRDADRKTEPPTVSLPVLRTLVL